MSAMFRQGDVLVRRVTRIPADAAKVENADRIVLAHGEATGHAHAIALDEAHEFSQTAADGVVYRFLEVLARGATLRHEEHAPILLPVGFYEILRQREYSPEEIRNVID